MSRCTLDTLLPPRRASQFLRLRRFTATLSHGFDLSPVRCAAALSCRRVMERLTRLRAFAACLFARLAPSVRSLRVRGRTGSRRCCRLYARATEHLALWNACQGAVSRLQTPAFSLNWSLEAFALKRERTTPRRRLVPVNIRSSPAAPLATGHQGSRLLRSTHRRAYETTTSVSRLLAPRAAVSADGEAARRDLVIAARRGAGDGALRKTRNKEGAARGS